MNPAGMFFGPNASLDVQGSFHVTTADYLKFADGAMFHADLSRQSVLTSAPVSAFGFLSQNPPGISIQGSTLQVLTSQGLSVIGGDVQIDGAALLAPAGKITIISDGRLLVDSSQLSANNQGSLSGLNAGVDILASGEVIVTNNSQIITAAFGTGDGGNVTISTPKLTIANGSTISTDTANAGRGGSIFLNAANITLANGAGIASNSTGTGDAGNITIAAGNRLRLANSSVTARADTADGGDLVIRAGSLVDLFNSRITTVGNGHGGNIFIDSPLVILNQSQISAIVFNGPGGNVIILADVLLGSLDSFLSASSSLGILAPITDLSGSLARLPENITQATSLLRQSCATRYGRGKFSSLSSLGRGGMPFEPGNFLASPLYRLETSTAQGSSDATQTAIAQLRPPKIQRFSINGDCP